MSSITDESIAEEFEMFSVLVTDENIFDKLRQLCNTYRLSAEQIAVEWVAFSTSKKQLRLNQETLEQLERERLSKTNKQNVKTPCSKATKPARRDFDISTIHLLVDEEVEDELVDTYSTPNCKGASSKRQHTPENPVNKRLTIAGRSPTAAMSPSIYSPSGVTSSNNKYSSRSNVGEAVCTFGTLSGASWRSRRDKQTAVGVKVVCDASINHNFKYMFQKTNDKALILNDLIDDMTDVLKSHYSLEDVVHVALPAQEAVSVVGMIACDSNGKLNARSVVLEGSRLTSSGRQIPVNLTNVPQYSLYPGQIVAMEGTNSSGQKFVATKIYEGVPLDLPAKPDLSSRGDISIVIAAGPFTTSDCLLYEALGDLVTYLNKDTPDVCILLGPFVDVKNTAIENADVNLSYDEVFKDLVMEPLIRAINKGLRTQLVVVPSQRDAHHDCVYPQPPFHLSDLAGKFKGKIHLVSDPCVLDIDGVTVAMTSTDILFHIGAEEISSPQHSMDRLSRLIHHVIASHSFYPLCPSSADVNVDLEHADVLARLSSTPHLLLLPSDLRFFVKEVAGSVCVNPGRLAKGQTGGTFARLVVKATGDSSNNSISQHVAAEVLRI